jgi:hypothetical protein
MMPAPSPRSVAVVAPTVAIAAITRIFIAKARPVFIGVAIGAIVLGLLLRTGGIGIDVLEVRIVVGGVAVIALPMARDIGPVRGDVAGDSLVGPRRPGASQ